MKFTHLKPKTKKEIIESFCAENNLAEYRLSTFISNLERRRFFPSNKVIFLVWSIMWMLLALSILISVIVAASSGHLWYPFEGGYKILLNSSGDMLKLIINSFMSICQFAIAPAIIWIVIDKMAQYDWENQ